MPYQQPKPVSGHRNPGSDIMPERERQKRKTKPQHLGLWASLPSEIRSQLLNTIVDQKNPGWSAFASVSKEWHSVIGARNMAKLKIGQYCLEEFGRVVIRQRHLVKHIYLRVGLTQYGNDSATMPSCTPVVSIALTELFAILSEWETKGPLTVELNTVAVRDWQDWFKNFRWDDDYDTYDRDSPVDGSLEVMDISCQDPRHGQKKPPPFSALQRLVQPIPMPDPGPDLAIVNAVTCLMIRRQMRRYLFPFQLATMVQSLPRLEDFIFEPWPEAYSDPRIGGWKYFRMSEDDGALVALCHNFALKRVMIFQDFDPRLGQRFPVDIFPPIRDNLGEGPVDNTETNSYHIFVVSYMVEELAVSFLIDVEHFLNNCRTSYPPCKNLKSLALTSILLADGEDRQDDVQRLLIETAKMALFMPKLTTFVLWTGDIGIACAFVYKRQGKYAEINWCGTWELDIGEDAIKAWNDVATSHGVELGVTPSRLITEDIMSHGDALYHLELPCQVIQPTSLWQIRMENQYRSPPIRA